MFKFINIFKRHIKGDILLCLPSPELLALVLREIRIIWILIKPFNFKYMGENSDLRKTENQKMFLLTWSYQ